MARTYRELEHGGFVRSRRGGGTRLAPAPPAAVTPERALEEAARAYLDRARVLGVSAEAALEAVRRVEPVTDPRSVGVWVAQPWTSWTAPTSPAASVARSSSPVTYGGIV